MRDELRVVVPEDFGRRLSIGVFQVKDLMNFVIIFVVFIAVALMIPNIWVQLIVVSFGLIFSLIFAFWKIDGLDFYAYLLLKMRGKNREPDMPPLYVYSDGETVFNGSAYFRIVAVNNGLPFDFMSDDGKIAKLKVYEQMLNACDFPLQIVIRTRKVRHEVFDILIKEEGELAEGYKKLIHDFAKDLYLQFYYVVVPVFTWELKSTDEKVRYRRARDMLDIRVKIVLEYLSMLGVGGHVVKGTSQIYEIIKSAVE